MTHLMPAPILIVSACIAAYASAGAPTAASDADGPADRLALVPTEILIGFDEPDAARRWVTVNDNVMGGRSTGGSEIADGQLIFSGSTNTNGGGFSSIRTRPADLDLGNADGLLYRVRGDGRTYIAGLRTGARFGSFDVSYWAEFETSGDGAWQTVRIPFDGYRPTMFGEDITGRAPGLQSQDIQGLELYIYDKEDGPFRLEVEWIGSFVDAEETLLATLEPAAIGRTATDQTREARPPAEDTLESHDTAAQLWAVRVLSIAIERGVPQFNNGNPGACADIYEMAIASIVMSPSAMSGDAVALLESGLRAGKQARTPADRAWAYRYAMDAAIGMFADQSPGGTVSPAMSVRAGDH